MGKKIFIAIALILILAIIGYFIYDIAANGTPPTENLIKMLIPVAGLVLSIAKVLSGVQKRRPLAFYEDHYSDKIAGAFQDSSSNRNKLLSAIRLYNENKFSPALNKLNSLREKCKTRRDAHAVGLFTALIYTDAGMTNSAINEYEELVKAGAVSSTLYSNLGMLYMQSGRENEALYCYEEALLLDDKNAALISNIANYYFDKKDFERAKEYATRALEVDAKLRPAANLLALIYSLEDNVEMAEKYIHTAVRLGSSRENIMLTLRRYRSDEADDDNELPEDDEED